LVEQGFIEVSTQSFAKKGDIQLANPLDKSRPYLRTSLEEGLATALKKAKEYASLVLPLNTKPKLFEVGSVFPKEGEYIELRMTEVAWEGVPTHDNLTVAKLEDYGKGYEPKRYTFAPFKPFSAYPYIVRDIALWTPTNAYFPESILETIQKEASDLLVRHGLFDRFEKDGRISFAFRLVFQSFDRTLTEAEINIIMEKISAALKAQGFEIR
jgi:phenylalanyl-tRNA synthetase beta subunit